MNPDRPTSEPRDSERTGTTLPGGPALDRTGTAPPPPGPGALGGLHTRLTDWFAAQARDLPWREPGGSAWGILVGEGMLQQTPVGRGLPGWPEWLPRGPSPPRPAARFP
ncbi:hypothetical protein AC792_13765, partial [Arthrobacter sp. RIT-PI-e]